MQTAAAAPTITTEDAGGMTPDWDLEPDTVREQVRARLADIISTERKRQGITARELCRRANLSHNAIGNIEKKLFTPSADVLARIARVLGIKIVIE